jgi:hypothetical protein
MVVRKDPDVLRYSTDPRELADTARLFAASPDPADQRVLEAHIGSESFLQRLDPPEAYEVFRPHQLRVAGIIRTLMDRDAEAPRQTLVNLTSNGGFRSRDLLIELLIRALAVDRPASPRTIAYWQEYLHPESVYADNVVRAIFLNRSRPALELFERVMNDPEEDDLYKYAWLRDMLLSQRNDPEVLQCCERMVIAGSVDPGWHEPILEAVFDFEPSWYLTCRKPRPPLRILAPEPSRDSLERLGRHGLTSLELMNPELKVKIRLALKEIGRSVEEDEEGRNASV